MIRTVKRNKPVANATLQQQDTTYQGWSNYQTWNIALWVGNDEFLYSEARRFRHRGYKAYVAYLREELGLTETPDEVAFNDSAVDIDELDAMLEDI